MVHFGPNAPKHVHWDLPAPRLYQKALQNEEGVLGQMGALVVHTGLHTGRLPNDKFLVREGSTEHRIWWGKVNRPMDEPKFEALRRRLCSYLQNREVFVQNCYVGADERYRTSVRVITEHAWHALFARNMFLREFDPERPSRLARGFTIFHAPGFHALPERDGTHSDAFVVIHLRRKLILIGGTAYAGEIKKSVFTAMNYVLPECGVMPMHCSANHGQDPEDVAIFFGLSGTGKTTLSADRTRTLIGDDEHGWSDAGVFNFEGGCYAKVIRLSREGEPDIFGASRRFGTILENVVIDPRTHCVDLDDAALTENTRASYPITHLPNVELSGKGNHPRNIIMLTCDAFGVLPPVARLTRHQAMYHFLAGYTAKIAGTEAEVTEPQATFSPCFGAPFMPLAPLTYAELLGEKVARHKPAVWLVNTGWSGGGYGEGTRIRLKHTRRIIQAILSGQLSSIEAKPHATFGINVPLSCPEVPAEILDPRRTWRDKAAYDSAAARLARMFEVNFNENAPEASSEIKAAGPLLR